MHNHNITANYLPYGGYERFGQMMMAGAQQQGSQGPQGPRQQGLGLDSSWLPTQLQSAGYNTYLVGKVGRDGGRCACVCVCVCVCVCACVCVCVCACVCVCVCVVKAPAARVDTVHVHAQASSGPRSVSLKWRDEPAPHTYPFIG